ncbi:Uncharacterised protein [Klebsiella pneumoniae]|uniref:Uncharacterized protein n=1 Tax=Klebsiella pneumoniae TaxID=573 RepID=A0A377XNX0_KLEPN|nr:Uncharacterised protein [Klebsiella pneumoniae]
MTITLQAVNELIASLESAGELSIREQKFPEAGESIPASGCGECGAEKISAGTVQ